MERMSPCRCVEGESMDESEEAAAYDRMIQQNHTVMHGPFIRSFCRLGITRGRLLDIGTGTGQLAIALARRFPELTVTAVDLSREMLAVAEKNAEKSGISERITFQQCDGKSLPFADNSFSSVISHFTLHHLEKPEEMLNEAGRVTVPDGIILIRDILRTPRPVLRLLKFYMRYILRYSPFITKKSVESFASGLTLGEMKAAVNRSRIPHAHVHRHLGLYGLLTCKQTKENSDSRNKIDTDHPDLQVA